MRLIKRGNYVPKSQIRCMFCGSILEITRDDLESEKRWLGGYNSFVTCCLCENRVSVSEEIVEHLNK